MLLLQVSRSPVITDLEEPVMKLCLNSLFSFVENFII